MEVVFSLVCHLHVSPNGNELKQDQPCQPNLRIQMSKAGSGGDFRNLPSKQSSALRATSEVAQTGKT
ncbi:Uncharacterized protein APZ42_010082 [Daphnia magna]|uniref:Uncharacterized protein n=1 Tax=Daphnia magna TaxID=35525 RepID=A0A164DKT4_9CRUS|nr:Uncharacterized protein APZ42_010082 [Daphnia magna]